MRASVVQFLRRDSYTWFAGALVLWNVTHRKNGPTVSSVAAKHPFVTSLVMMVYLHHFNEERLHRVLERLHQVLERLPQVLTLQRQWRRKIRCDVENASTL